MEEKDIVVATTPEGNMPSSPPPFLNIRRFQEAVDKKDFVMACTYVDTYYHATPSSKSDLFRALKELRWRGIWGQYSEDRAQFWEALLLRGIISPEQAWEFRDRCQSLSAWIWSFLFGTTLTRRFLEQHALNNPHFRHRVVEWRNKDEDEDGDDLFAFAFYYHCHLAIQPLWRIWQASYRISVHSMSSLFNEIFIKSRPDNVTPEYAQDVVKCIEEWITLRAAVTGFENGSSCPKSIEEEKM